ncbi:MAG TPA: hypothetical protein VK604_21050 [Bryobacteraceae bacterium]|nr:hypothetical protein [Bryobacteraceae bacterium]
MKNLTPARAAQASIWCRKDEDGFDTDPVDIGKNLVESLTKIDIESAHLIRVHVNQALRADSTETASALSCKSKSLRRWIG